MVHILGEVGVEPNASTMACLLVDSKDYQVFCSFLEQRLFGDSSLAKHVQKYGLLWELPTPHINPTIGSTWESSHPIGNCESFQVPQRKLRCLSYKRAKCRFSFSSKEHNRPHKLSDAHI